MGVVHLGIEEAGVRLDNGDGAVESLDGEEGGFL